MASTDDLIARNAHMLGEGAQELTADQVIAWTGFLAAHQRLFGNFAAHLERTHDLSPSALGLLGRLCCSNDGRVRLTQLAAASGLSLSRVSRIVDALEARELVERQACPGDGRAINAHITRKGRALARKAQATSSAWLHEQFFDHLDDADTAALARAFGHFIDGAGPTCESVDQV